MSVEEAVVVRGWLEDIEDILGAQRRETVIVRPRREVKERARKRIMQYFEYTYIYRTYISLLSFPMKG